MVQYLGSCVGSLRGPGSWRVRPGSTRHRISTRLRTHQSATLKVNDLDGIPVEVAITANWRVTGTALASFEVEDVAQLVGTQCEMALRQVVADHRFQPVDEGEPSLSANAAEISERLSFEVKRRVAAAGVAILERQLARVACAPEIAQAMSRRQQAAAIVAARQQIVDRAVGMVELAPDRLEREHVVELDEERKATMVSNLLVDLCSHHGTQPMVNTGSLYL